MGYEVDQQRFVTSDRALLAVSVAGAGFGWVALLVAPLLVIELPGWPVASIGLGAIALVALLAFGIQTGQIPVLSKEVTASNIVATRGDPTLWLVAHSDSKSQALSLAGRIVAVVALATGMLWLCGALATRLITDLPWWAAAPGIILAVLGGAALSRGAPSDRSPGAVDNATGVVAVLAAAERLRHRTDVGVLVTGAEEYGMAGARAWTESHRAAGCFINFDGIDSRGPHRIALHAPRGVQGTAASRDVGQRIQARLHARGHRVTMRNLPPGVFVDGVVLARSGMPGATLSRGDWATARAVHTAADRSDRVDVRAATEAAQVAAETVGVLLG
jgi:hypothetical protein